LEYPALQSYGRDVVVATAHPMFLFAQHHFIICDLPCVRLPSWCISASHTYFWVEKSHGNSLSPDFFKLGTLLGHAKCLLQQYAFCSADQVASHEERFDQQSNSSSAGQECFSEQQKCFFSSDHLSFQPCRPSKQSNSNSVVVVAVVVVVVVVFVVVVFVVVVA